MKFCCDQIKQHLTNNCEEHGLECPDNVIRKFGKDYGIPHSDGSYYLIKYCPFCGTKLKKDEN